LKVVGQASCLNPFRGEYILDSSLKYNDRIVRRFAIATVPDIPWLSYGRQRPLHTGVAIFA